MRFASATISGFAGISRTAQVDLDANVVVLLGSNGFGKSTICDALFWALTGKHPRGADPRSWYGTGETYVEVSLREASGQLLSIRRMVANPEAELAKLTTSLVVETGSSRVRGPEAEFWLARRFMSDPSDASSISTTLTDSLYLQQDSLREFLSSRSDDERFAALSQMVGARALSDLVGSFDAANRAWRKAVRQTEAELDQSRSEIEMLRAEIANLEQMLAEAERVQSAEVEAWWAVAGELLGLSDSGELVALRDLESAVADLNGMVSGDLDRKQRIQILSQELAALLGADVPEPAPGISVDEFGAQEMRVSASRQHLEAATAQVQAARSALQAAETQRDELSALAQLALRHLSDACPTCGQDVDPDALRRRLENILTDDPPARTGEGDALSDALSRRDAIAAQLAGEEVRLQGMRSDAEAYERYLTAKSERESRRQGLMSELTALVGSQISSANWRSSVDEALARIDSRVATATEHVNAFQVLAPALRTGGNAARLASLKDEYKRLQGSFVSRRAELEARTRTQQHSAELLDALKSDSESFLNDRLRAMHPVLEQLYAAIDPHPTLQQLQLETRNWYGKNRLSAILMDSVSDVRVDDPGRTLSTSQANALAVTLFLGFNLGLSPTQVESVVLDDPLQNLDDVHLLGLVDLLRRIQPHRQLILTTHDAGFAELLCRKMRPLKSDDRLTLLRIEQWDRQGPRLVQETPTPDPQPMKLIATA